MRLIYGTTNPAKLDAMRRALAGFPAEIIGLGELSDMPENAFDESGNNPLENAVIKAKAYYNVLRQPVFSCDSGLYCDNLPDELQPGAHVRRAKGKTLSDEEMIAYYGGLAVRDGMLHARYRNAICLVMDESHIYQSMAETLASMPFGIVEKPCPGHAKGFPLDSLSVRLTDGRYYLKLPSAERAQIIPYDGFSDFLRFALATSGTVR